MGLRAHVGVGLGAARALGADGVDRLGDRGVEVVVDDEGVVGAAGPGGLDLALGGGEAPLDRLLGVAPAVAEALEERVLAGRGG
jgi:hypothetical protein